MHRVIPTDDYRRAIRDFPRRTQAIARRQVDILASNWRDPRLHIKKLKGYGNIYSFRITRNYRAFFYFDADDDIIVFDADDRKDAYR